VTIHRKQSRDVEVITSVERRRPWTAAEKQRLVAATLEPGSSVSAIAREAGIHPGRLYGWRRQLRGRARMRITGAVEGATLRAAIAALSAGRQQ
jgi:transposase